ncbi:MAG: hypothetical protein WBF55_08705 [Syntrophobacteria bacterium]
METSSLAVQGKANRNQEQELGQNGGFAQRAMKFSRQEAAGSRQQAATID